MGRKKTSAAVIEDEDFAEDEELKEVMAEAAAPLPKAEPPAAPVATLGEPVAPKKGAWKFNLRASWMIPTLTLEGIEGDTPEAARKALHDLLDQAIYGIERTR